MKIEDLWKDKNYEPNDEQKNSILHTNGPLYITAAPGSGKTAVLVWRTLYLIVFQNVKPEKIFLATFTEKAAFQLKERLQSLLSLVAEKSNGTKGP
ncbi:MAG TPA: UvrD-helicase domain-containing protein, partial [Leptospiraceae bacterium]|nr:UvrD-helicase domain-containing protein [Leptospiraceae bacterium]